MYGVINTEQSAQFLEIPPSEDPASHSPCAPALISTAPGCSPHQNLLPPFARSAQGKRCPLQRWAW